MVLIESGSIIANCYGCKGGKSTFEWKVGSSEFGAIELKTDDHHWSNCYISYRLFKCAGCGQGALGIIKFGGDSRYPGAYHRLISFYPSSYESSLLPDKTPKGIKTEFREAEKCLGNNCFRAAAGLFRSVLDKTFRDNGYKQGKDNLKQQIDNAAKDGIITEARKNRAHNEVRVLGNDVLHDEWKEIPKEDVEAARHYCQRILEDFYDDRTAVLELLHKANRSLKDE